MKVRPLTSAEEYDRTECKNRFPARDSEAVPRLRNVHEWSGPDYREIKSIYFDGRLQRENLLII